MEYTIKLSATIAVKTADTTKVLPEFVAGLYYIGNARNFSISKTILESEDGCCLVDCEHNEGDMCTCKTKCPYTLGNGNKDSSNLSTVVVSFEGEFAFESDTTDENEAPAEFFEELSYTGVPWDLSYHIVRN